MHPEIQALKNQLSHAYSRNQRNVAYIDESYRSAVEGLPFYLISAVIIQPAELDEARDASLRISDNDWWHTTSAFQRNDASRIRDLLESLATGICRNVIAVQPIVIENNLEHSRRECLIQLINAADVRECGLVVIERRQSQRARRADIALIAQAMHEQRIPRHLRLFQTTPSVEQLLWLPDVLSWSMRRLMALGELDWVSILNGNLQVLNISLDANPRNKKRPQRAAAKGCGPTKPVGSVNEGISRSSALIMPHGFDILQHFPQHLGNIVTPPFNPAELSAWIRSKFPH